MKRRQLLSGMLGAGACAAAGLTLPRTSAVELRQPLPRWVPRRGTRSDISYNVMADVDPCPRRDCSYTGTLGQQAVLAAWCGAAFATNYGALGAWVTTGGGHEDYFGNEVYAFELDTRRWVRLNDPYPGGADTAVDYAEGEYAPGIPLSSHTYQHSQYLPPELGGGPKGALLRVVAYAAGRYARGSGRAHACDLATGQWTRFSMDKAIAGLNGTSATCVDLVRGCIWRVPPVGGVVEYLDLATRRFGGISPGTVGDNNFVVNHTCALDPERDVIVVLDWRSKADAEVWVLPLADPQRWWRVPTAGPAPPLNAQGVALEWCPPLRAFVGYEGNGATFLRKLVPPAGDPRTSTWQWHVEELGGDAPACRTKGPRMSFSRFRWAPSLHSFLWADGRDLPVQAWRPQGT